jgi:16S rRNA (cytosine1402-N4)-methyltransferase
MYHEPVLLNESITGLNVNPSGIYVDVTFGGGGHSRKILNLLDDGKLFSFDQDPEALRNKPDDDRIVLIDQNYRYLKNFLKYHQIDKVDGVLADLGISSHQIDTPERGFSTRYKGALDLRMDNRIEMTGAFVINTYADSELYRVLKQYGEVKNPSCLVEVIIKNRETESIATTEQLINIIKTCAPKGREFKYYAQVFQALRIEVNDEMGALKELLIQTADIINKGGRLVVISYHSLEDRLVKNFIRSGNFEGEIEKDFYGNILAPFSQVTRKPVIPEQSELEKNPRSRSAKMRIAEKT